MILLGKVIIPLDIFLNLILQLGVLLRSQNIEGKRFAQEVGIMEQPVRLVTVVPNAVVKHNFDEMLFHAPGIKWRPK